MKKFLNLAAIFAAACIICLSVTSCAQPSSEEPSKPTYSPNGTYAFDSDRGTAHLYKFVNKDRVDFISASKDYDVFAFSVFFSTNNDAEVYRSISILEPLPAPGESGSYTYETAEAFGKVYSISFTITAGATRDDPFVVSNFTATEK